MSALGQKRISAHVRVMSAFGLMWSEIDLNARTITLPGERTKNGEKHVVPLSDTAMSILAGIAKRDWHEHVFGRTLAAGFSGWSSAKAEFDANVKIEAWVVHDLRRTVSTGIDKLGTLPHICEAVLNHLPPKLVRTYNQNTYENEKRKTLDTWAHHPKTIVAQSCRRERHGAKEKAALVFIHSAAQQQFDHSGQGAVFLSRPVL